MFKVVTLFETLLSVAIHKSVPSSKAIYCMTLRLPLTKGLGGKLGSIVPCGVYGHLSTEPPCKRDCRLSTTSCLRSSHSWVVVRHRLICDQHFDTAYLSHFQGSRQGGHYPKTWVTNLCHAITDKKRSTDLLEDSPNIIFWRGLPLLENDKTSEMMCYVPHNV